MPQPEPPPRDKLLDSLLDLSRRMRTDTSAYRSKAHKKIGRQGYRLDIRDLERHINGDGVARGQYLMLPGSDTTKVAVLDLDSHKGETPWPDMLAVAGELVEGLREQLGLIAHPWRSNGGAGIHLWFVWDEAQDSYSVRETLREFIGKVRGGYSDGPGGLANKSIEIFPKQDVVEEGRFGSQVWLPLYGGGASAPLEADMVNGGLRLPRDGWRERLAVTGYTWRGSAAVANLEKPKREVNRDKLGLNKAAALLGLNAGQGVSVPAGEIARLSEMLATVGFDNVGGDDYTYSKWLTVGMGLHEATSGGEDGLALWRDWSALGAGYGDAGAVEAKWDSFGRGTRERLVTVRSIEHMARESGWVEDLSGMFETPQDAGGAGENPGDPEENGAAPDEDGDSPGVLNPRDRTGMASRFLSVGFNHKGAATLLRVNGDWYAWAGTHYRMREDEAVRADMQRFLDKAMKQVAVGKGAEKVFETVPFLPSVADVTGALDALGAAVLREGVEAPALMGGAAAPSGKYDALDLLALQDGLLHIPSRKLLAHTPAFFNTAVLPYSWKGSDGLAPRWVKFLEEVFPGDAESQETLQEIFGYLLTSDTSQQKMFLIQGEPRSGKGTIGRVIRDLAGLENVTGTSFQQLAGDFGMEDFIGKSIAILPESRNTGNRYSSIQNAVERLLTQTGEDAVSIARKFKRAWHGRLRTRFLMLANQVPALGDSSGAFASRFIVLRTAQSFLGREETELYGRLRCELPQIFKWSLDGLDRLRKRGHFIQPAYAAEALEELADSNNHTRVFLRDECEVTGITGDRVEKKELYGKYRDWCFSEGRSPDMHAVFCKNVILTSNMVKAVRGQLQTSRVQFFAGLKIKSDVR